MIADPRFLAQPGAFWANIPKQSAKRSDTPCVVRAKSRFRRAPRSSRRTRSSTSSQNTSSPTKGNQLHLVKRSIDYFTFRAERLNGFVEPRLMNAVQAGEVFANLRAQLNPQAPLPINKQKGDKKAPAFLDRRSSTCSSKRTAAGDDCDFDPRVLTTVTRDGLPVRTLARRVDGAFPCAVNPVAVWGSRNTTTRQHSAVELRMVCTRPCWMAWNLKSCASRKVSRCSIS